MKREDKAKFIKVATRSARENAAEAIKELRTTEARHLTEATLHALLQAADLIESGLADTAALNPETTAANAAALNLQRAAERLLAVADVPEAWAGMGLVAEALQLIGAASAQAGQAAGVAEVQAKRRRDKPGSLDETDLGRNDRMRRMHAQLLAAHGEHGATSQTAAEFGVSRRTVQRVLTK